MPTTENPSGSGLSLADVTAPVTRVVDGDQMNQNNLFKQTLPYSTTIAVGSNGAVLPQATIYVASTVGAPTSGSFWNEALGTTVAYTGITSGTFTGCTGGTGTLATGQAVTPAAPNITLMRLANLLALVGGYLLGVAYLAIAQTWTALQTFASIAVTGGATVSTSNTTPALTANGGTGAPAILVNGGTGNQAVSVLATSTGSPAVSIAQSGTGGGFVVTTVDAASTAAAVTFDASATAGGAVKAFGGSGAPAGYFDTAAGGQAAVQADHGPALFTGTGGATPLGTPIANACYGNSFDKAAFYATGGTINGTALNASVTMGVGTVGGIPGIPHATVTFVTQMADAYYQPTCTPIGGQWDYYVADMTQTSFKVVFLSPGGSIFTQSGAWACRVSGTQ